MAPGDLIQADIVGPRYLDGGIPFSALNVVDIASHAAAIEIVDCEDESALCHGAIGVLERLGVPRRLQLDNGKPFVVGGGRLGEFVRMLCWQGTTPLFIPQGEPWRNGVCERFNDAFDQRFYRSERFGSRAAVRERALAFERFHNQNHRYRASGRRTPEELRSGIELRSPAGLETLPDGWPQQGRIEFIRLIRSDRQLRLMRRRITVPKRLTYRYVTATVDLAIPDREGNLAVVDHEGELVMTDSVALGR